MIKRLSVKEVSKLAGISVRTLHYYDQIGLLKPDHRTDSNYRLYSTENIATLWNILYLKELDFSLSDIVKILSGSNGQDFLTEHKHILEAKRNRLNDIITSIDKILMEGFDIEMVNVFNYSEYDKYKEEAIEKYGKVAKDSFEKTDNYSKNKWDNLSLEMNNIFVSISKNMEKEVSHDVVQSLVSDLRNHITANFYACNVETFRGLGCLYVGDERFTNNIDKIKGGLADYVSRAIKYYCDNV